MTAGRGHVRDEWLTTQLEVPAYRLCNDGAGTAHLPPSPAFIYARVPTHEVEEVHRLSDVGFRVVDAALTFSGYVTTSTRQSAPVREAISSDESHVTSLCAEAMTTSRFHLDPGIDNAVAERLKTEWVTNYFRGRRGDGLLVADAPGRIDGFLLWLRRTDTIAIDLIATAAAGRRRGVARSLIAALAAREGMPLEVTTQASNIPSARLYQAVGLRLTATAYVMHAHR